MNHVLRTIKAVWAMYWAPAFARPITWDEAIWLAENVKYGGII